jgi:hypothetical protein
MTRDDVRALRDAMIRFHAGVKEGYANGRDEGEIRKSLDLAAWNKLERSYMIGRNINRAYLEIEADSFDELPSGGSARDGIERAQPPGNKP